MYQTRSADDSRARSTHTTQIQLENEKKLRRLYMLVHSDTEKKKNRFNDELVGWIFVVVSRAFAIDGHTKTLTNHEIYFY